MTVSLRSMAFGLVALSLLGGCKDEQGTQDSIGESVDLDALISTERPGKRGEIYGIADEVSNSVLVFGGNSGPIVNQSPQAEFNDETWIFEPGFGWTQLDIEGPSARGRYGAAYDATNRRALIFGGRWRETGASGNYKLFNELWAFDFEDRTWSLLGEGGPSPRYYPSVGWDDATETLYVVGGLVNKDPAALPDVNMELWSWKDGAWTELDTSDEPSKPRAFLGEAYDPVRQRMVLFQGQVGDYWSNAYADTWAVDVTTGTWSQLNRGKDVGPSTRMHPHALYDEARDRYILFGGHTDIGDGNDLWVMDPESGDWSELREADSFTGNGLGCNGNPSDVPEDYVEQDLSAPERRHRGMFTLIQDNLWIFGGMHAECSEHLDDTWRYPLDGSGDWTQLIEARTGESCLRSDDDCECLCY